MSRCIKARSEGPWPLFNGSGLVGGENGAATVPISTNKPVNAGVAGRDILSVMWFVLPRQTLRLSCRRSES